MHHLLNKTALQKQRGSPLALAVLFWMDETVPKANIDSHYSPPEIRLEFPWNAGVQFLKSDFSIQIIYILFGLTQYVSALQLAYCMVWHCLRKDNNSFDLLNCMYFEKVCFWLLRTVCNVSNDFFIHMPSSYLQVFLEDCGTVSKVRVARFQKVLMVWLSGHARSHRIHVGNTWGNDAMVLWNQLILNWPGGFDPLKLLRLCINRSSCLRLFFKTSIIAIAA